MRQPIARAALFNHAYDAPSVMHRSFDVLELDDRSAAHDNSKITDCAEDAEVLPDEPVGKHLVDQNRSSPVAGRRR